MTAYVYDKITLICEIEATPVCGKHFCDECGDCLACDQGPCYGTRSTGEHLWVVYFNEADTWTEEIKQAWRDRQTKPN